MADGSCAPPPAGPLGQGMRDSHPEFNPIHPALRASWADLRHSGTVAMPQPLGEGLRWVPGRCFQGGRRLGIALGSM